MPSSPPDTPRDTDGTDRREAARFERVDWSETEDSRRFIDLERAVFFVGLVGLVCVYLYDHYVAHVYLVGTWNVAAVDWLFMLSVVVLAAYGGVPIYKHRGAARRTLGRLREDRLAVASGVYLACLLVLGLLGPVFIEPPRMQPTWVNQPPYGATITSDAVRNCAGAVSAGPDVFDTCHGSLAFPLGTDYWGRDMVALLASGARVVLYITVVTIALVIPIATVVGAVAGYYGGVVDDLLMAYVDAQLTVPALVVYLVAVLLFGPSLFLLLVVFGLLSWGSVARAVRSETLQRREAGFILAARGTGAEDAYTIRRHVLPNVTNTVVPSITHLIAVLVLTEAGIAFLGFEDEAIYSWGATIADGLDLERIDVFHGAGDTSPLELWWISTIPAVALTVTVFALKTFGDGLRDALDPRSD